MSLPQHATGSRSGVVSRRWSQEEVRKLHAMRAQRKSTAEIAAALGRTETAVSMKINVLGVAAPVGGARNRPCLCCGNPFRSEGFHNRLCNKCRKLEHGPF